MSEVTSAIARSLRACVGWNTIGAAIGLTIVVVAAVTLFHLLRDIDTGKVALTLQATPLAAILISACFVAISYVTLTFYDFFSLRTIGRNDVPYRIAALAGFIS
jgi:uncharacterized membrane protein YbhN (UPF0104 family)